MTKSVFKLKQFDIAHEKSSMKVGTDAMILGAITKSCNPKNILDIGTGSGILALMLAQRFPNSKIQAIDIHRASIEEAAFNVKNSIFNNVVISESSLQSFAACNDPKFDLIISNPPFFKSDLKSTQADRNYARHNDRLSFEDLIANSKKLLNLNGEFWFILPERHHEEIIRIIEHQELYLNNLISLFNDKQSKPVRRIYGISKTKSHPQFSELAIRINGEYSKEYIELTKDFHNRNL